MNNDQRQEVRFDKANDCEHTGGSPIRDRTPTEEVQPENAFLQAFGNHLITDKILAFLNFEDMKALSAVSKKCCGVVRSHEEFKKRAVFTISHESAATQVLQKSNCEWRHISIHLPIPNLAPEQITNLLKPAKSISLWLPEGRAVDSLRLKHSLTVILSIATDLESLVMDASIFKIEHANVYTYSILQTLLARLKVLAVQSKKRNEVCNIDDRQNKEDLQFEQNFCQLAVVAFKLKKFVIGKLELSWSEESNCRHVKYVAKIINASRDTLEDLELHRNVWKLNELRVMRCPKLKRLVLSAYGPTDARASRKDSEIVEAYLRNQPPLEELVIKIKGDFPLTTLQTLHEKVTKMKKLHITAKNIPTSQPVNWNFLGTMNELKDFLIRRPKILTSAPDYFGCGVEILAKLPSTVEKISLQGFDKFWKDTTRPKRAIGELLSRFINLTEIDFWRSVDAVTDLGLQSIITNCRKLTYLVFSHCEHLTDFGLSGVKRRENGTSEEKVGVSLKDLKGLVCLQIRCCRHVSPECLLKVVEFDFLRFFYYDGEVNDPRAYLTQVARQNPCLEEVTLRVTNGRGQNDKYLREMKEEVKETNPRVRIIDIPVYPHCDDMDSESDASWCSNYELPLLDDVSADADILMRLFSDQDDY